MKSLRTIIDRVQQYVNWCFVTSDGDAKHLRSIVWVGVVIMAMLIVIVI